MRVILTILGIIILSMVGFIAIQGVWQENEELTTIENETFTPANATNITALNDSNLPAADYNSTVTVRDSTDTVMDNGTDYRWIEHNGTVQTVKGGGLDGESSANITYGYRRPPDDIAGWGWALAHIPKTAGFVAPLFALVFLILLFKQ